MLQSQDHSNSRDYSAMGSKPRSTLHLELFLKIVLPFKNKNYFTLDNLSKYGHITLKFFGRAILVQKLAAEKKMSKSLSDFFMKKKQT